jgi:pyochelin synthetase
MNIESLLDELKRAGIQLWREDEQLRFRAPRGEMTAERKRALQGAKADILAYLARGTPAQEFVVDLEHRYDPFPLTEVQAAYLIGRGGAFELGGVSCQVYLEIAYPELEPERVGAVWNALIRRHDMLRATVHATGYQVVSPTTPPYEIAVADERRSNSDEVEASLTRVRRELAHRSHAPDQWPLFELRITRCPTRDVLHFSIDLLLGDYLSVQLLLDELNALYQRPECTLPELELSFRDYLYNERRLRESEAYARARAYWLERIDSLPPAPELPTLDPTRRASHPSDAPRFRRHECMLSASDWATLKKRAGQQQLTPSGVLLAAYAEVIGRWCGQRTFTLDLTLLNRLPLHPQIDRVFGDFTSVSLLAVDRQPEQSFAERARALQARLWQDMEQRAYSGIDVLRELARRRGSEAALAPVVFTSALGMNRERPFADAQILEGEIVHGLSQTPQVWIDCQVMERAGALALIWDVREGVFPRGMIEDMFDAFRSLVHRLLADSACFVERAPLALPGRQVLERQRANAGAAERPSELLHEGFLRQAARAPERIAVIDRCGCLSYAELSARANAVAKALLVRGCRPGECVAIIMSKGWEQVAGVLGTLLAGAVYVPIDVVHPPQRRATMLRKAEVRRVLSCSDLDLAFEPDSQLQRIDVDLLSPEASVPACAKAQPADLAYVIYTSGSTGEPKGVMIAHGAALNTLRDIERRFALGAETRVLGLANLGFDLSVFDIFGPLSCGGCLVLPDPTRRGDPSHWADLIEEHAIQLWNSVPVQLQMLLDYLEAEPAATLSSLRTALLSGDWIPVNVPARVRERLPGLEVVSLGGATEASIWSIAYPIDGPHPDCARIPYGKPLANQQFHVLDADLDDCPEWVPGELFIAGPGLALGYIGDAAQTAERFIRHPRSGARLYRTGDYGRYLPDGNIEFLGRRDTQIKLRGHRIELGEIEAALLVSGEVARATVVVNDDDSGMRRLVAFAEPALRTAAAERRAHDAQLMAAGAAAGRAAMQDVNRDAYVEYHRVLDRIALLAMLSALRSQGLFASRSNRHTLDEILAQAQVAAPHHRLVRRWLRALCEHGLLRRDAGSSEYFDAEPVSLADVEQAWDHVDEMRSAHHDDAKHVHGYFRASTKHLAQMLRADGDPVRLLFPDGRVDVTENLYNLARFNQWANRIATDTLCRIAEQHCSTGKTLRVLEVGAGVGGTSTDVIPALAAYDVEYLFTDLSQFFLNKAAEKFSDYPWVRYGVLNLDQDYRAQGILPNSFDVILSGDVLHSTRHIPNVLERVRELLAPGGWFVFLEMTRDHYQILTSMELLLKLDEQVADFEDDRRGRDQTFVSHPQWLRWLADAGAEVVVVLPEDDDVLTELGMYVYAARFKGDRCALDPEALRVELVERLPEYMIPAQIQVVDRLPLTENRKIDGRQLREWVRSRPVDAQAAQLEEPQTELEIQLAQIWAEVFHVAKVYRTQRLFDLGGDSLIATQIANQVRERVPNAESLEYDTLLRRLLGNGSVQTLAEQLSEAASAEGVRA